MEKTNLILNSAIEIKDNNELEGKGKGRLFISKFIEPGVAHYEQFGDVLITKETLDKFIQSMVGCPVIIKHKDITDENVDKERVGVVSKVWYSEFDGWYWCEGILWDKQAIDLIKNQGWSVSCTYDFESDKQPKTHNGKKIDMEFIGGEFLHLALVDNPRYERANIVVNSNGDTVENDKWITIKPNGEDGKGKHLLLKDGESPKEAIDRTYGKDNKDNKQEKKEQPKEEKKEYKKEEKLNAEVEEIRDYVKKVRPDLHFNYNKKSKYPYEIKYRESKRFNLNDIATSSDKKEDIYEYLRQQTKEGSDIEKELTAKIKEAKESKTSDAKDLTDEVSELHSKVYAKDSNYGKNTKEWQEYEEKLHKLWQQADDKLKANEINKKLPKLNITSKSDNKDIYTDGRYVSDGNFAMDINEIRIKKYKGNQENRYAKISELMKGYKETTPIKKDVEFYNNDRTKDVYVKLLSKDNKNIYINKKYYDLAKDGTVFETTNHEKPSTSPLAMKKNGKIIGVVMPIDVRDVSNLSKIDKAQNAFLNGLEEILDDYKPVKEDLPILEGLKDILKD